MPTSLPAAELRYWLALHRTPLIGAIRFHRLQQVFPQLADIFRAPANQLAALKLPEPTILALQNPDWHAVDRDLHWAQNHHHHILTHQDPHYPSLLKQTSGFPALLFVRGELTTLSSLQLAIVGSRNPTPSGVDNARQFAHHLSSAGLTITSGLALGIDAASHQGALKHGGKTLAVLGSGLDCIYPKTHQKLAEDIAENGALVSEYPLGTKPNMQHFPQRNRIVSGLSLGVLVIEATIKSGSLITARLAAEQGRDVFAIPGSIHNPLARGCHLLIRQGAKLVETAQDIIEELSALSAFAAQETSAATVADTSNPQTLNATCQKLLDCVGFEPTTIDQLINRSGFSAQQVAVMVLTLELAEKISGVPGGYMKL